MRQAIGRGLMATSVMALCAGLAGAGEPPPEPIEFREIPETREFTGELIAKPLPESDLLAAGATPRRATARHAAAKRALTAYEVVGRIELVDEPARVIRVPEGRTEGEMAAELMATGNFEYVHPNWRVFALDCPNDPEFDQQWHHEVDLLDSCAGWDIYTGDPSVSVGICDTGVDVTHGDLDGNHLDGYNATTELFESEGGEITPTSAHGTRVAGCAAGEGDDGFGITGVGQDLSYRPVRVSESGSGSSLDRLLDGALTAIGAGDRVANVSFSGVGRNASAILDAATSIEQMGGMLVWSAGNNGALLNFGDRDADDLIVVGATNMDDELASFSARGPSMDLVAPGVDVYTASPGNDFATATGTSFAAPLTAGLAALIFSADPSLTPDEVEQILKSGAEDLGDPGADNTFGYGRINVYNSLTQTDAAAGIELVGAAPDQIDPSGGTSFQVQTENGTAQQIDPASGRLHFDDGSGFSSVPLTDLGGGIHEAAFPETACPARVAFYVSFETQAGDELTFPPRVPAESEPLQATAYSDSAVTFHDDFETDQGWTVTNSPGLTGGAWERGVPADHDRGDPPSDFDGSGQAYLTENDPAEANTDVDGGTTTLTSPVIELSGAEYAMVSYARWYSNHTGGSPLQDPWIVEITDDGSDWVELEHTTEGLGGWVERSFFVHEHVELTDNIRVRFIARDDPGPSIVEAAVDAFEVASLSCGDGMCPADLTGDGEVTSSDFLEYIDLFAAGDPEADFTGDGAVNSEDFLAFIDAFAQGCP